MLNSQGKNILLEVKSLKKYFPIEKGFFRKTVGYVKAVDDVDFSISRGNILGLVGESGSGKTTLGRCLLRAIEPTKGEIIYNINNKNIDITSVEKNELRSLRRYIQMIFQDPYSSLDPRMTVLDIIGEPLRRNNIAKGRKLEDKVKELAKRVGLDIKHLKRYPHAFSGGQRQRIGIARSLAPNPEFIVADEPVSALDVSVQAQVLNLLQDLQEEFDLTFLFIAHDLSVIEHVADRVAVMYVGNIVELAKTEELYLTPKHPYTEALLSAMPIADPLINTEKIILPGEVANPADPPSGCYFHPRCKYCEQICQEHKPQLEVNDGHMVACHLANELKLKRHFPEEVSN